MADDREEAVAREYRALASRYEERWAFYVTATVRETLQRLTVRDQDRLLDVGCGTGALMRAVLAGHPRTSLTGVDISAEMLAVARRRLPSGVDLHVAPAHAMPLPDDAFDIVVSTSAFHFFPSAARALAEMRRVLRPGGTLAITDWCDDYLACRLCHRMLRLFNRAHVRVYGSAEMGTLLTAAGFEAVRVEPYKISWLWGLMTAIARKPGKDGRDQQDCRGLRRSR